MNKTSSNEFLDRKPRARVTQSCDRCRFKKRRCDGFEPCENCTKANALCIKTLQQKKRGPKKPSEIASMASMQNGQQAKHSALSHKAVKKRRKTYYNDEETETESISQSEEDYEEEGVSVEQSEGSVAEPNAMFINELFGNHQEQIEFNIGSYVSDNLTAYDHSGSTAMNVTQFGSGLSMNASSSSNMNAFTSDVMLSTYFGDDIFKTTTAYNPPTFQPLEIDPEVLNLYAQLYPKMADEFNVMLSGSLDPSYQQLLCDTQMDNLLFGSVNLGIAELPGLKPELFLHLITMFFTYYHPTFPVITEERFLQQLIPENKIHPMLLNAVYAIGCRYSLHPQLYQAPFLSPAKAGDFFMNKAYNSIPPPDSSCLLSSDALAVCQASLILSSCDVKLSQCRTWMMVSMACRLAQKYELFYDDTSTDFFAVYSGVKKCSNDIDLEDRKRVWWGALVVDLFVALASGNSLLLNESDYMETMLDGSTLIHKTPYQSILVAPDSLAGRKNGAGKEPQIASGLSADLDKWKPFFSGYAKDTIFASTDVSSERWSRRSTGYFQVQHMFSDMASYTHFVQLSFIVRKIIRISKSQHNESKLKSNPTNLSEACLAAINTESRDILRLHESLLVWYESLPTPFRIFNTLEALTTSNSADITQFSAIQPGDRVSGTVVLLNVMFFAAFAILHEGNARLAPIQPDGRQRLDSVFRISSSLLARHLFDSEQMIVFMYKAQSHLIKTVYGTNMPPSPSRIPPSEIVCTFMIGMLLMPTSVALLGRPDYARKASALEGEHFPQTPIPHVDSLNAVVIPVLKNIAQVWPMAADCSNHLLSLMDSVRSRLSAEDAAKSHFAPKKDATHPPSSQSTSKAQSPNIRINGPMHSNINSNVFSQVNNAAFTGIQTQFAIHNPVPPTAVQTSNIPMPILTTKLPQLSVPLISDRKVDPALSVLLNQNIQSDTGTSSSSASAPMKHDSSFTQGIQQSWNDLRNEFENEFLL